MARWKIEFDDQDVNYLDAKVSRNGEDQRKLDIHSILVMINVGERPKILLGLSGTRFGLDPRGRMAYEGFGGKIALVNVLSDEWIEKGPFGDADKEGGERGPSGEGAGNA